MADEGHSGGKGTHPFPEGQLPDGRLSQQPTVAPGTEVATNGGASALPLHSTFGPYRILRLLGSGGMGAVYEAEEQSGGRRVALKVLRQGAAAPSTRQRFLREGRLAAQLSHPHSVYIYGTEEIDNQPVITMERMTGGTLEDRVQHDGPLSPHEAADAILQVIEGLEAAAAMGILHRDVKPSNCFVDQDGVVKVGDYGLSISTEKRDQTQLTATGVVFGTPSYASPEQLQGKELDERSDLYSVGATLYYLLTGKPPFDGQNMVQLLSAILQEDPVSPAKLRPEIPRKLARVVLRCLAKKPSSRYSRYGDLVRELFRFTSSATAPATLSPRFLAGVVDLLIVSFIFPNLVVLIASGGVPIREAPTPALRLALQVLQLALGVLYFAIGEGIWGSTPGKAIMGLLVVGRDGRSAGIPLAGLRALVFLAVPNLPAATRDLWASLQAAPAENDLASAVSGPVLMAALFFTARRSNGFAALHGLWTKTRVLRRLPYQPQHLRKARVEAGPGAGGQTLGKYQVDSGVEIRENNTVLGWDAALQRRIWIRGAGTEAPPVTVARQELSRSGRLRWLDGRREPGGLWDAFEAPSGNSLASTIASGQPWSKVRYWLVGLAAEFQAALQDGSMPETLGLDRIWITERDDCKLLDLSPPTPAGTHAPAMPVPLDDADAQETLFLVASFALEGNLRERVDLAERGAVPIPLGAREFLHSLREHRFPDLAAAIARLKELQHEKALITRRQRARYATALSAIPLLWAVATSLVLFFQRNWEQWPALVVGCLIFLILQAFLGLFWAAVLRGGLLFTRLGIVVVGADGARASRRRTTYRSLIGWSPVVFLTLFPVAWHLFLGQAPTQISDLTGFGRFIEIVLTPMLATPVFSIGFGIVVLLAYLAAMIRFVVSPGRSLQDRIAGTHLVPR